MATKDEVKSKERKKLTETHTRAVKSVLLYFVLFSPLFLLSSHFDRAMFIVINMN